MNKPKVDWSSKETINILSNPTLSLKQMAEQLGVKSIWNISRERSKLGLDRLYSAYGHKSSNKERKARYNAKIKQNKYKPLYTWRQ